MASELRACDCSTCGDVIETVWRNGKRISPAPAKRNERPICEKCVLWFAKHQPKLSVA